MSHPGSSSATPTKTMSPGASAVNLPATHPTAKSSHTKPKPINVFSNDGSFLERFQRNKKEEDEKKKQEDLLAKKRAFDERFKKRGKRKIDSPSDEPTESAPPAKKAKELTQYEKEVKSYEGRSLKDNGIGIRPLVK